MIVRTSKTFHIQLAECEAKDIIDELDKVRLENDGELPPTLRTLEEAICEHFNV